MRKHLTRSDYAKKPWKNGRGFTEEIFVYPNDHFLFRISMAALTTSGPFSSYPGIDRTLVILEGEPVSLNGRELPLMTPFSFSGDQSIHAGIEAPGRDFNLMCRRDEVKGKLFVGESNLEMNLGGNFFAVFSAEEKMMAGETELKLYETLLLDKTETGTLSLNGSRFIVIEVTY